ncbi:MAG: response regulator [Flavobacteriales bacterium]
MSKSKIAVIEDNEDVRENLVELLELTGYQVQAAANGRKGIEVVRSFCPDLILCDVMMPELDGYGVVHILAKDPETASIPFIFLTAKADKIDFRKGMTLGADDYITKPYDDTDLVNAIETRLKKSTLFKSNKSNDSVKNLSDLLEKSNTLKVKAKDKLYHQGDLPKSVYYIKKGKFKLFKTDTYGKEFITNIVEKDNIIGYTPLINGNEQAETAEALEDSEVQFFTKEDFLKALENNSGEMLNLLKKFAKNITEHETRLLSMAYASLRERVADRLIDLSKTENEIFLSRNDIANSIGTATESLIRVLSEFRANGCIEMTPKSIKITNRAKLISHSSSI